jgi:hypothetical protein
MAVIRVACGRLYNANACSLVGRKDAGLTFRLGATDVEVSVGPNLQRHLVPVHEIGPPDAEGH